MTEFLVQIDIEATDADPVRLEDLKCKERVRAKELASAGYLTRLWRVPGRWANIGIWRADNEEQLRQVLDSLPLRPYMRIVINPLASHRSDPGRPEPWIS
jgi:muconolactone delta-isomerase